MTERSAWTVVPWKRVIEAGLLTTTEASPSLTPEPANAAPSALTLFSLSWKPDAWAGARASTPAMPSARAEAWRRGEIGIAGTLLTGLLAGVRRGRRAISPALGAGPTVPSGLGAAALYRGGWSREGVPRHGGGRYSCPVHPAPERSARHVRVHSNAVPSRTPLGDTPAVRRALGGLPVGEH